MLVDDLAGTVHRAYGELPANVVLIDAAGRIAFEQKWPHVPTLHQALDELLARASATDPVQGGVQRRPHMLAAMANGWHALARGGPHAVRDLALIAPPVVLGLQLGRVARPLLAPVALRHRPLPAWVKAALGVTATLAALKILRVRPPSAQRWSP